MTNQCVGCQDGWRPGECKICSPTANDEYELRRASGDVCSRCGDAETRETAFQVCPKAVRSPHDFRTPAPARSRPQS